MMEMILKDFCQAYGMRGIALRYFNPIGADPKMRSGIHQKDSSLIISKLVATALGKQKELLITGTNWPTRDGTGIRDYVHVWDLARAHVQAVTNFDSVFERAGNPSDGYLVINLGTGTGITVKELVSAFEKVWGKPFNKREVEPRPGDVAGAYTNNDRAREWLSWQPEKTLEEMISDALRWGEVRGKMLGYE
jgi:UDP-glucose 4-epimerase